MLWLPLVLFVPLQPPEAVHDVALAELHVSEEAAPLAIEVGFAASVTAGVPGTVTVAVAILLVPPAPVHVNEYAVVAVRAPVLWLPLVASAPLQPPEAAHDVAADELQISVEAVPLLTVVCAAPRDAVGAGGLVVGVTPAPPHAANTRDAATGTNRIPGSQDFIVINHPRAIRNCALVRYSIGSWPAARQAMLARVQAVSRSYFIE